MIRLRALQLAIAAWKTTLEISGKFRPRTWLILAVLCACISGVALWAYQARTVSPSEIPPVPIAELDQAGSEYSGYLVIKSDTSTSCAVYGHMNGHWKISGNHQHFGIDVTSPRPGASIPKLLSLEVLSTPTNGATFTMTITGSNFTSGTQVFFVANADRKHGKGRVAIPSAQRNAKPEAATTVPCDPPPLLSPGERQVALLTNVASAVLNLLMVFFYWQQWRLRKSQELLFAMQIRELQERFDLSEKARLKHADEEHRSVIIIP